MTARPAAVLSILALALALAGWGGDDDTTAAPTGTAASSSSSSAATSPRGDSSSPSDGDGDTDEDDSTDAPPFPANTEPDTGAPTPDSFVTVTDVRTGRHDGFDRVVFEVDGPGTPGWDVRYVESASGQASGEDIPVAGDGILQVTITGVGYPTETGIEEYDGAQPLPGNGTEAVTEVAWDSTFEGTSVAFVGTTQTTPFRVYLLEDPNRVVVDVVHPR